MQNQGAKGYQETLLADTLDRMRRNPEGRKVVHLHLSDLMPQNRTPVRLKIVTRMFRTLESGRQAQLFALSNDDLVMIINGGAQRDVNNILHRIRKLFDGDPITMDGEGGDRFTTWYDLSLDAAMAVHAAQQMRIEAQNAPPKTAAQQMPPQTPQMLDVANMKPDYAKIMWAPELQDMMDPASNRTAAGMVEAIGAERVILSRCDSANALAWGLKSGIGLFQGYFLDSFNKARKRPPQAAVRR